jgi:glycosyltransferase involved in cell wall biosynthesis
MKVSIIVPTRNRADLLARAVQALAAQSHRELEVIVIDDGSTEPVRAAVREVCASHPGRVCLIEHGAAGGHGSGPAQARNAGIAVATGEVIGFCDDDDEWTDPQHLARVIPSFEQDPALDLHIANQVGMLDGRVVVASWLPQLRQRMAAKVSDSTGSVPVSVTDLCAADGFPHLNTVLLRRQALPAGSPFWTAVRYEEDRDFFWRLLDRCRGITLSAAPMAIHHIPDAQKNTNASTQHARVDRLLISAMVSRHISLSSSQPMIRRLAFHAEGDINRQLAVISAEAGDWRASRALAWVALTLRFSWKWLAYCAWLSVRSSVRSSARSSLGPSVGSGAKADAP